MDSSLGLIIFSSMRDTWMRYFGNKNWFWRENKILENGKTGTLSLSLNPIFIKKEDMLTGYYSEFFFVLVILLFQFCISILYFVYDICNVEWTGCHSNSLESTGMFLCICVYCLSTWKHQERKIRFFEERQTDKVGIYMKISPWSESVTRVSETSDFLFVLTFFLGGMWRISWNKKTFEDILPVCVRINFISFVWKNILPFRF